MTASLNDDRELVFDVTDMEEILVVSTSDRLKVGSIYTREQLRDLFEITDATLNNGIFRPKDTTSVWLFITDEKTPDRVQYSDHLEGDVLLMQGQTEGRTDHLISDQATNGLELLVFHRTKKYEHDGAGFRYLGPFNFVRSFGSRPTSFVLVRDDGRQYLYGKQTWRWALEAVQQLGGRATRSQVEDYIITRAPEFKVSNAGPDLSLISVNDYGRSNWSQNQAPRRSDRWSPYDALFRRDTPTGALFELYDPAKHGVWELAADAEGVMRPFSGGDSSEIVNAQDEAQAAKAFDAANDADGREKVVASIVQRRGQPKFRRALLSAYAERCAVTECPVTEILEGAHIKSYLGDHTNHVTNGLLLRADIHTMFDLGLLRVDPVTWKIEIAPRAQTAYGQHHGQVLRLPAQELLRPDIDAVRQHYERVASKFAT